MARMRELDAPVQTAPQIAAEQCGDPMNMPSSMPPSMNDQPPPAHPSMSVNLNAQGMDNIESLLKLMTKVNPDMINQPTPVPPMPALAPEPSIMSIKPPMPGIGDLGNLDSGPLKMLPDLDSEPEGDHPEPDADNFGGPSDNDADNKIDVIQKSMGDMDSDGDKDEKDLDSDDKDDDEEKKKDEWANSPADSSDEQTSFGSPFDQEGNDIHKSKETYPKVAGGDNPMQKDKFRESIRAELQKRLNEAKGAK